MPRISNRRILAITTLLVAGLVLRLLGALHGLPFGYHPDEEHILEPARAIAAGGGLDPGWYRYPPLPIWIHSLLYAVVGRFVEDVPSTFDAVSERVWVARLVGRAFTAFAGIATVAVVWRAVLRSFGSGAALLAAGILTTSLLHVQHSSFITTDVLSGLAAAGTLALTLAGVRANEATAARYWIAAAALAGIAAAMKYNAGLVAFAPLSAWVAARPRETFRAGASVGVVSVGVFFCLAPVLLLRFDSFAADLLFEVSHYADGGTEQAEGRFAGQNGAAVLARFLVIRGIGIVGVAGVVVFVFDSVRQRRWIALAGVMGFPALYFAFLSSLSVVTDRNLLPLIPFATAAAAVGLASLTERTPTFARHPRAAAFVTFTLAVLPLAAHSIWYTKTVVGEDTRSTAYTFIQTYVPERVRLCREYYAPEIPPGFRPFSFPSVCLRGEEPIRAGCDVVVTSSFTERLYRRPGANADVAACYDTLASDWTLIGRMSGVPIDIYNDPTIRIYANPGLAIDVPAPEGSSRIGR